MPVRTLLALLALLCLPVAAAATHRLNAHPVAADLDGDAHVERLVAEKVRRDGIGYRRAVLHDDCDGTDPGWHLSPVHDIVPVLEVREADGGSASREVYVEARSGASGRAGVARLYRYADCLPAALFRYSTAKPRRRPPRGTWVAGFGVSLKNYRRETAPLEIRLVESLGLDGRPSLTANGSRITYWRLRGDRYVVYRKRVTRPTSGR